MQMSITLSSSKPAKLWYSFRGIINAAKFAVYKAKNTTANNAQILDMNLKEKRNIVKKKEIEKPGIYLAVNPRGQSTLTEAWNKTATTSQYVRKSENLCPDLEGSTCIS